MVLHSTVEKLVLAVFFLGGRGVEMGVHHEDPVPSVDRLHVVIAVCICLLG